MFKELKSKEYLVIVLLAVFVFVMLLTNPQSLQNKNYKLNGDACPNPAWHAIIVLLVGTALFLFVSRYQIKAK